jgi:hydrogenase maturation protein HypF
MTSGNLSEEPIATDNDEARRRLSTLADAFLMHNRDIRMRCDDSVVRVFPIKGGSSLAAKGVTSLKSEQGEIYPIRRSRGYAPFPVKLPWDMPATLAVGAELKNTFCLSKGQYAFLSHHVGDLENYETMLAFEDGVSHYERLYRIRPEVLAYDLHPNYLATRFAIQRSQSEGLSSVAVQHHHAHIAACMAEHGLDGSDPIIGISFDGTGYGEDGAIWGGEILVADYESYQRPFHLRYIPLPGGELAIRQPWRLALAWLDLAGIDWGDDLPPVKQAIETTKQQLAGSRPDVDTLRIIHHQIKGGVNSPLTSSMGRLFDAVSSLIGVRQVINYEAQAAIELETLVDPSEESAYPIGLADGIIDPIPLIKAVVEDQRRGRPVHTISARFHHAVAQVVVIVCCQLRDRHGLSKVALSGGVWQNITLLAGTVPRLQQEGFTVYVHRRVPANDGGISLGQAVIAAHKLGLIKV